MSSFVFGATDQKKVEQGAWFEESDVRFLVARHDNNAYQQCIERLKRPHRRKFERQEVSAELLTEIVCRAMSKHMLLGWEGIKDQDGKDVPYSEKNAYQFLMESPNLRDLIASLSREEEAFFGNASNE